MTIFLVTGATGYVGSWCVKTLLDAGHRVRGTVRDPAAPKCNFLKELAGASERLTLVKADLLDDLDAWRDVVRGSNVVMHTASPFVAENVPSGEEENFFLKPAVQGTESVLGACVAENVKRVVLTSSVAAVSSGHDGTEMGAKFGTPPGLGESCWTNLDGLSLPDQMYFKSKTVAEQAAWNIVKDTAVELAVVLPAMIVGPFQSMDTQSGSVVALRVILNKEYPAIPDIPFNLVDVRDVAKMHLLAATTQDAMGKRFLCVSHSQSIPMYQMAAELDAAGWVVPRFKMPKFVLRIAGLFDAKVGQVLPSVGTTHNYDVHNGNKLMGDQWIDYKTSLAEMAESLHELGGIGRRKAEGGRARACLGRGGA